MNRIIFSLQSKYLCQSFFFLIILIYFADMINNCISSQPSLASMTYSDPSNPELHSESDRFNQELRRNFSARNDKDSDRPSDSQNNDGPINCKKQSSLNSRDSWRVDPPKSSNHNFQKHTVVTVKKLARRLSQKLGLSPEELIAQQMWNIFLSSGIKSKKILVILFGRANLGDEKYKDLLKGCFFGQLCNYEEALVRRAQDILRVRVLQFLNQQVLRASIQRNRHIRQKQSFIAYFIELIDLLNQGPLLKFRINTLSSLKIEQRIRTANTIAEERNRRRMRRPSSRS